MKISGLVKKVLFGTALVVSTFLPSKLNAQYPGVLNRLTRPNEVVDKYGSYGSGDVDQDGDVDWDDNVAMDSMKNFYSDVDGDGDQSTAKDKKHHTDYLNGLISYLQGDYDALKTPEERKSWIGKIYPIMTELNGYEFIPPSDPRSQDVDTRFDSDNGGQGDYLTGNGYNPNRDDFDQIHEKYNLNYNGLFNLPFCDVTVTNDSGFAHTLSGLFTGDSVKDLENIIFLEPQEGRVVEPGQDWSIPYNSRINFSGIYKFENLPEEERDSAWGHHLMNIYIDGQGNKSITDIHPDFIVNRPTVAIGDEKRNNLEGYSLEQNFPNPFNPTTTMKYSLPNEEQVNFKIYDINGREVETLLNNKKMPAGEYEIHWDPKDNLTSGIYFGRLRAGKYVKTKKLTYTK